jgi:UDP-glucuronate 4-epimerase
MSACILVTGGNGFVGRAVCRALQTAGAHVVAADIDFDACVDGASWEQVRCDVTDPAQVQSLFRAHETGRVVHAGAISGPMLCRNDPLKMHRVNAAGTLNLLEAARTHRVERFVLLSSIAVYGDHLVRTCVAESAPLLAADPYGSSKVAAERFALCYKASFDLPVVALRVSSIYGPGRRTQCLVRALIDSAKEDSACVDISRSPLSMRQLVHIDDCVQGVLLALNSAAPLQFAYNLASGTEISEAALAETIAARYQGVRYRLFDEPRFFDGHIGRLDIGAAVRDLGFVPRVPLEQGLSTYASAGF